MDMQQEIEDVVYNLTQNKSIFSAYDVTTILRNKLSFNVKHNLVRKAVHNLYDNQQMNIDYSRDFTEIDNADVIIYRPYDVSPDNYKPKNINANTVSNIQVNNNQYGQPTDISFTVEFDNVDMTSGTDCSDPNHNQAIISAIDDDGNYCDGSVCAIKAKVDLKDAVDFNDFHSKVTMSYSKIVVKKMLEDIRLTIPVKITRNIGLKPHDLVSVFYSTGQSGGKKNIVICKDPNVELDMHKWGVLTVDNHGNIRLSLSLINACGLKNYQNFTIENYPNSISVS